MKIFAYPCIGGFHFMFIDGEHLPFPHNPRAGYHQMPYHVWAGMEKNNMHNVGKSGSLYERLKTILVSQETKVCSQTRATTNYHHSQIFARK
jgi:hypothetical protein